jgi:hypothetical protein
MKNEWPASFLLSSRLHSRKSSLGQSSASFSYAKADLRRRRCCGRDALLSMAGFGKISRSSARFTARAASESCRIGPNCGGRDATLSRRLYRQRLNGWYQMWTGLGTTVVLDSRAIAISPGSPAPEISGMRRCIRGRRHPSTSVVAKSRLDQCRNRGAFESTMKCVRDSSA